MEEKVFNIEFIGKTYPSFYIKSKENALIALERYMQKDCLFGIDVETASLPEYKNYPKAPLNPHLSEIRLLQVSDGNSILVFDIKTIEDKSIFYPFLSTKKFVAHNALFEIKNFRQFGVPRMNIGCTFLIAKFLFHANYPTEEGLSASLGELVDKILDTHILKKQGASDWSTPDLTFEQVEYAAIDAIATLKLAEKLSVGIDKFKLHKIYGLYKEAQHAIASLELNGMGFNKEYHRENIVAWRDSLVKAKDKLRKLTGLEDITGDKMNKYLLTKLSKEDISKWKKTATGRLQTSKDALAEFAHLDFVKPFLEFQKRMKLCSSFGENIISYLNPETGRIHSQFNLSGARTGRLSSSNPNSQQYPRTSEDEKHLDIRRAFVAREGYELICADYSQIELRVAAEISKDPKMLEAYRNGIDLHALTASQIAGKPLSRVTKKERQLAKAINFGLLFGLGPTKFCSYAANSYSVEVSQDEALHAIEAFRELYAVFRQWQLDHTKICEHTLRVKTPLGKVRKLDPDNYYGASLNTPIQGGAAEIMLKALVYLNEAFQDTDVYLVNCVHDEVVLEVPIEKVEEVKNIVRDVMIRAYLDVFPKGITRDLVGISSGKTWADAK